ncbi:hypothetical protein KBX53_00375 [Micromonospora sp. M51]|uniref:competence protein CoiA family protein n=1 Tax=Micromonospora sp. M51 TaxID=2824889 RepID=UPI001B37C654|nr:competence protein CoiA family protein [Micromonospora sp. M51]MBQ1009436.1 hypothetical protein [Micromonospora sp. M51]
MNDLSVVGLDLRAGSSVHVDDEPKYVWKAKGYAGDETLVCWHCYDGVDAPAGTRVPLLCRGGRKYGKVRTHFAHPSGQASHGGHRPKTLWHANAKQTIKRWAKNQPGVTEARTEYWTADGRRRSDVEALLTDGTHLVVEVQQQPLTDEDWTHRHHDYVAAGLVDVWLRHARLGVPGIARSEPQCHWLLSPELDTVGTPLTRPHSFDGDWWNRPDHRFRAPHHPPCPGDMTETRWAALTDFTIGPTGFALPITVLVELRNHASEAARLAETRRRLLTAASGNTGPGRVPPKPAEPIHSVAARRLPEPTEPDWHEVHRIDALPPDADPALRRYRCQICNWVTPEALTEGLHNFTEYP